MQEIEQNRQAVIHRFVAACQTDESVVAASLGGSYARDATDAYSDIDFGLITKYEAFCQVIQPDNSISDLNTSFICVKT